MLASGSKLLGKEWVWFVQPQESSTDSSEESKGESSQEPSTKPSTDKPTMSPEIDSILTPPKQDTSKHKSYKRDRFTKAIFADDKLKILRAE